MRALTVSRFSIGTYDSYYTLRIYIEDYNEKPDIVIKGVPCRLLGKLRSGETRVFSIGEEKVKVFAIMGKMLRNYKYDYRIIEAGNEDVYLSGKSCADRSVGGFFYFDGDTPFEVSEDNANFIEGINKFLKIC
ncbi:MAG: hypothetical protein K2M36_04925, partial [Clostridia bacterium]|nr:hypothetical protein [Clostridia bacterium]